MLLIKRLNPYWLNWFWLVLMIRVFSLENGLIRHKGKIWVGQNSAVQTRIISALHSSPIGGAFRAEGHFS